MIFQPILFSGDMVIAILERRKFQTRRIVNCRRIEVGGKAQSRFKADRLWVKETWRTLAIYDHIKPSCLHPASPIQYAATDDFGENEDGMWGKTRPSIFMPRIFSRITLDVNFARVERLHDISEEDAIREGIGRSGFSDAVQWKGYRNCGVYKSPIGAYRSLFDGINGDGAFDRNPLVDVVDFRLVAA